MRITKKLATVSFAIGAALAACSCTPSASAMEFSGARYTHGASEAYEVDMTGDIRPGDTEKFKAFLRTLSPLPAMFNINSTGGDPIEALELSKMFGDRSVVTVDKTCSAACLIVFFSAGHKIAASTATIGMPFMRDLAGNVTNNEGYDAAALSIIRSLLALGVPEAAIKGMVTASLKREPGMSVEQLKQAGVRVVVEDKTAPPQWKAK